MTAKVGETKEKVGLVDNGKVFFTCSNCDKKLAYIWRTSPSKSKYKYRATCPYCNDKSWDIEVEGNPAEMGFSGIWQDIDENNDKPITLIENIKPKGDVIVMHVVKAQKEPKNV